MPVPRPPCAPAGPNETNSAPDRTGPQLAPKFRRGSAAPWEGLGRGTILRVLFRPRVCVFRLHCASPGPNGTIRTRSGPGPKRAKLAQDHQKQVRRGLGSPFIDGIHLGNVWAAFLSCFVQVLPLKWCWSGLGAFGRVWAQVAPRGPKPKIGRISG